MTAVDVAREGVAPGRRWPDLVAGYASDLVFFLNGRKVRLTGVDPDLLLADYLRSPGVGLTGTKIACGEGGCGACTVTLSTYEPAAGRVVHSAINACLRRVSSLDGTAITTIEGLVLDGRVSPLQDRLVRSNGTQCGFCTPGIVMNMHSYLIDRSDPGDMRDIVGAFEGNLCRCTGYRPILDALKSFASDWKDAGKTMECRVLPSDVVEAYDDPKAVRLPELATGRPRALHYVKDHRHWIRPLSLVEAQRIQQACRGEADVRLINGGTGLRFEESDPGIGPGATRPSVSLDLSQIPELQVARIDETELVVGGGVSYSHLLVFLDKAVSQLPAAKVIRIQALRAAAANTAARQVRNAGTVAGNTFLVARLWARGLRFPSDLVTAMASMGVALEVTAPSWETPRRFEVLDFLEAYRNDDLLQREAIVLNYRIPFSTAGERAAYYRTARRSTDSTAIVNAGCRLRLKDGVVEEAALVFGGLGLGPVRAREAEAVLVGAAWDRDRLRRCLQVLERGVPGMIEHPSGRWDGITDDYRRHLAIGFLYKFLVAASERLPGLTVSSRVASASLQPDRPVSTGTQVVPRPPDAGPFGVPYVKEGAILQATGAARYTQDLVLPPRGLEAAFVTSTRALARFEYRLPDAPDRQTVPVKDLISYLRDRFEGFVDLIVAEDGPALSQPAGDNAQYDPLLANGLVTCFGQPIGLVVAETARVATQVAALIQAQCLVYQSQEPCLSIAAARERPGSIMVDLPPGLVHIQSLARPGSDLTWVERDGEVAVNGIRCEVVHGAMATGGQAHFYLETQACLAEPGEGDRVVVYSSTQWPAGVHDRVRQVLGRGFNEVTVRVPRLGGGYGGKSTRSPYVAAPVAFAAAKLHRPVRVALPRETDFAMIGKRHPFYGEFYVAVANGKDDPRHRGRILGLDTTFWADGGNSYDCSFNVMDCAQLQADAAYHIPNYRTSGNVCRTHTASNNAMRSYGALQAVLIQEDALEAAAHRVGMSAEAVRRMMLYAEGDETPCGQRLDYCHFREMWTRLEHRTDFVRRSEEVRRFNDQNLWRKRGIAILPLKYGFGFYASFLEQGGALVEAFGTDGTVLIRHGGVEMGQGITTKVAQLAAMTLNLPLDLIRTGETDTQVIPDPIPTGGSTGTQLNSGAVREASRRLRKRLEGFCLQLRDQHGDQWCRDQHVNFWDYPNGWSAPAGDGARLIWHHVVQQAFTSSVNLSGQARFAAGTKPVKHGPSFAPGVPPEDIDGFEGFTYAAACSEVEVDVLTGETTVLRSDILYDMGDSLNPAIDVGQIEGGFVQGLGHVLTEELVYQPDGPSRGALTSLNTMDYKPPAPATIPLELNVDLFPRDDHPDLGTNPDLRLPDSESAPPPVSSKGVGEPPLVLAATVYFAVKHAVLAARRDRGHDEWFRLDTPATVQRVREACLVEVSDLEL